MQIFRQKKHIKIHIFFTSNNMYITYIFIKLALCSLQGPCSHVALLPEGHNRYGATGASWYWPLLLLMPH